MALGPVLPDTLLVLDTDILTEWRYQKLYVRQAIDDYMASVKRPPVLTSVTVFEALYGIENKEIKPGGLNERTARDRLEIERLIQYCGALSFNQTSAEIAAYISARLGRSKYNEHREDIFIAATALAHDYGVATRNRSDFELIANHLPSDHALLRLAIWKP